MIYSFSKGGGQPNPVLSASADLFCNANSIGGNCGREMSPWLNLKSTAPVIATAANYTIKLRDCGSVFTNRLSDIDIVLTLPPASRDDGGGVCRLEFNRYANRRIMIKPFGTDVIKGAGGATAAAEMIYTDDNYASLVLEDQSDTSWVVKSSTGTWLNSTTTSPSPAGRLRVLTFATLPTCTGGREGTSYAVTDSNSVTFNATLAGGGANHVAAYCNGTAWVVR
jgi:hypothetical protein